MGPEFVRQWNDEHRVYQVAFVLDGIETEKSVVASDPSDALRKIRKVYFPGQVVTRAKIVKS